ncbi:MAG: YfhO family protein [Myxococcales bacterium]
MKDAGARGPRPEAWLPAYTAAALLVLAFHYRLALPGRALVANDFRALFIPLRGGLQNTLKAGEWPFWQRGMFFGYPLLGDIQVQLFNPLTWLTLPLDPARGVTVQSLIELCLCACGTVFWMKQRGLRPIESVFAGAAFALCLKETVHLHHWTFAASTCAWPWMLAGLDGFATSGRARFLWLTALATCGTWVGASPQMAYFGTGLAFLYALFLRRPRAVAAVVLGVALAAPLLWPAIELNSFGPRGAGITYRFAASWSWPDRRAWIAMLLPRYWGGRPDFHGPMNYWELQGYFGLVPMALLPVAPLRKRGLWLFAAVAILGIWTSFGDNGWLRLHYWLFRFLPGFGGFRNPTRALMLSMLCVTVLAAEGLSRLRDEPVLRFRVLVAAGVLALGVVYAGPATFALLLLACIAMWGVVSHRWALVAIPLALFDVAYQTWDSPEIGPAAAENHALERLSSFVPAPPRPRRVAVLLDWGEMNNATYARGWEGVTGYAPSPLQRVLRLFEATWIGRIRPPYKLYEDENFPRFRPDSPITPLFGAPLLAANRDANIAPLTRDGDVRLYELPALPRVFFTRSWQAAIDEQSGTLLPQAATGAMVVLSEPIEQPPGPAKAPVPAEQIEVRTNSLRAMIDGPEDGIAVILDPWFPGWRATVDGVPAHLQRAYYAFMALPIRKGKHVLDLVYFPDRLLPGIGVAIVALALLFLLAHRVDTRSTGGYFPPP